VICAGSAAKPHDLRESIRPIGKINHLAASALWFCHLLCNARGNVPPSAVRPKKQKRKRHELPRRRPTRGRTRRDAGSRARRQSRLDPAETHGVTPLATRSRRRHVSRGKRRAAQLAARLNASRGLTSRPLCGLAESRLRSVCSVNLRHEARSRGRRSRGATTTEARSDRKASARHARGSLVVRLAPPP
jgi:hypothetical protein